MAFKLVFCAILVVCLFETYHATRIPREAETDAKDDKQLTEFKEGITNLLKSLSDGVNKIIQDDKVKELFDDLGQKFSEASTGVEKLSMDALKKFSKAEETKVTPVEGEA